MQSRTCLPFPSPCHAYVLGSGAAVLQSPLISNIRISSATQSVHFFFLPHHERCPASTIRFMIRLDNLWLPKRASVRVQSSLSYTVRYRASSGPLEGILVQDNTIVWRPAPGSKNTELHPLVCDTELVVVDFEQGPRCAILKDSFDHLELHHSHLKGSEEGLRSGGRTAPAGTG